MRVASKILVTGGAGFIGSALVRMLIAETGHDVVNLDLLTYAGNLEAVSCVAGDRRYHFERADIADLDAVMDLFDRHRPDAIIHLAAETHVDRSIDDPLEFIRTNVVGTGNLLRASLRHWEQIPGDERAHFRFLHVSTDEVYGSLGDTGSFSESDPYDPHSPYAASKAASDHLARAWWHTYRLPVLVTNCSNNYGPYHFPEKLIPLTIIRGIRGQSLPVYGAGANVRDWLHVEDHARALLQVLEGGRPGETYNIGGCGECRNLEVVERICDLLDTLSPRNGPPRRDLITLVPDRPGHDFRYAMDATKIRTELGWEPRETFATGLERTVRWYLDNRNWWETILARGNYDGGRLGHRSQVLSDESGDGKRRSG